LNLTKVDKKEDKETPQAMPQAGGMPGMY